MDIDRTADIARLISGQDGGSLSNKSIEPFTVTDHITCLSHPYDWKSMSLTRAILNVVGYSFEGICAASDYQSNPPATNGKYGIVQCKELGNSTSNAVFYQDTPVGNVVGLFPTKPLQNGTYSIGGVPQFTKIVNVKNVTLNNITIQLRAIDNTILDLDQGAPPGTQPDVYVWMKFYSVPV